MFSYFIATLQFLITIHIQFWLSKPLLLHYLWVIFHEVFLFLILTWCPPKQIALDCHSSCYEGRAPTLPDFLSPFPLCLLCFLPASNFPWCRSVPNFNTVPPNKLNWTVIFVVIDGSMIPLSSWAANTRRGLFQKSRTDMNFPSHTLCKINKNYYNDSVSSSTLTFWLETGSRLFQKSRTDINLRSHLWNIMPARWSKKAKLMAKLAYFLNIGKPKIINLPFPFRKAKISQKSQFLRMAHRGNQILHHVSGRVQYTEMPARETKNVGHIFHSSTKKNVRQGIKMSGRALKVCRTF